MLTFRQFFEAKKIPQIAWDASPSIGWWGDAEPLRVYHGTNAEHLDSISVHGLDRLDKTTGMISFAFEPFTARAFSVMGGEARFLGAGAKAKVVPEDKRIVLVFDLPHAWVSEHQDPDLRGNDKEHLKRLREKEMYHDWGGTDQQYYQLCELRVNTKVPASFLKGYMIK